MASVDWIKRFKPQEPTERRGPPDTLRYVEELPAAVLREMRTADPDIPHGEPEPAAADLVRLAIPVVEEIQRAALELQEPAEPGQPRRTCLAFLETRNELTGQWGIVVCRQNDSGSQSRPLAELLTRDDEWTQEAKETADALGWCASNKRLSLVAIREPGKEGPRRFVMLCGGFGRRRRDKRTVSYLARVLITPLEVAQWREADERWLQ